MSLLLTLYIFLLVFFQLYCSPFSDTLFPILVPIYHLWFNSFAPLSNSFWFYLSISRVEHFHFRTFGHPQVGNNIMADKKSPGAKMWDNRIFELFIHSNLISAFYTSRAELVIPLQICLAPYMDTHIMQTHTHSYGQLTVIHIYTPTLTYIATYVHSHIIVSYLLSPTIFVMNYK